MVSGFVLFVFRRSGDSCSRLSLTSTFKVVHLPRDNPYRTGPIKCGNRLAAGSTSFLLSRWSWTIALLGGRAAAGACWDEQCFFAAFLVAEALGVGLVSKV